MAPARGGSAPDQSAEKRRRELGDRGEREQADRGKLGVTRRAIIKVGEQDDAEDRQAACGQQQLADIVIAAEQADAPLQHQRHDDVVRHHDRQRHRFNDHHGGRSRQASDEGGYGDRVRAVLQRQRQHKHVAVDAAGAERDEAGDGDRHNEQVDQHQIERKQPGRALDFPFVVVFDHGDVELARQQDDRDK